MSHDLVYVVRPGDNNEELRFSLRSVAENMPDRRVWIFGHTPSWVTNVDSVELEPLEQKFANINQSLLAAAEHPEVSDTFILMNDDYFILRPVADPIPVYHLGDTFEYIEYLYSKGKRHDDEWFTALRETYKWRYHRGFNCHETHTPLPFNKHALSIFLGSPKRRAHWSTLLAPVVWDLLGEWMAARPTVGIDVKVSSRSKLGLDAVLKHDLPYLSTVDHSFKNGAVGEWLRARFPDKCRYER